MGDHSSDEITPFEWRPGRAVARGLPYVIVGCALGVAQRGHFDADRMAVTALIGAACLLMASRLQTRPVPLRTIGFGLALPFLGYALQAGRLADMAWTATVPLWFLALSDALADEG